MLETLDLYLRAACMNEFAHQHFWQETSGILCAETPSSTLLLSMAWVFSHSHRSCAVVCHVQHAVTLLTTYSALSFPAHPAALHAEMQHCKL